MRKSRMVLVALALVALVACSDSGSDSSQSSHTTWTVELPEVTTAPSRATQIARAQELVATIDFAPQAANGLVTLNVSSAADRATDINVPLERLLYEGWKAGKFDASVVTGTTGQPVVSVIDGTVPVQFFVAQLISRGACELVAISYQADTVYLSRQDEPSSYIVSTTDVVLKAVRYGDGTVSSTSQPFQLSTTSSPSATSELRLPVRFNLLDDVHKAVPTGC